MPPGDLFHAVLRDKEIYEARTIERLLIATRNPAMSDPRDNGSGDIGRNRQS
jgi:hypothetical protein